MLELDETYQMIKDNFLDSLDKNIGLDTEQYDKLLRMGFCLNYIRSELDKIIFEYSGKQIILDNISNLFEVSMYINDTVIEQCLYYVMSVEEFDISFKHYMRKHKLTKIINKTIQKS